MSEETRKQLSVEYAIKFAGTNAGMYMNEDAFNAKVKWFYDYLGESTKSE